MATGIIPIVKQAAIDAVDATNPVKVVFGTVVNESPVQIKLDSSLTLSEDAGQLKLTRNVTDYEFDMTIDHVSESYTHTHKVNGETLSSDGHTHTVDITSSSDTHTHKLIGKKKYKVHNALKVGEIVLLLKMQGGQCYVVVDRMGASK